jgi:UDP-N-acetylglucosamine 4,6-dehydratase
MQKVLITGGTGSLGKKLIEKFVNSHYVICYSRDEGKQALLPNNIVKIIGDVRDIQKLDETFRQYQPDYVIHTAALKRVDDMEFHPDECVKTNVMGSSNVANACIRNNVTKCILISTDKACKPINVYGASKFIAERIFINCDIRSSNTTFSACRYGNVIASRGSFIPIWIDKIKNDETVFITDKNCTRFLFTLGQAAGFVTDSLTRSEGGEVFVPKLNSYKILDVLNVLEEVVGKKAKYVETGIRPGEKIHEDMLNDDELPYTHEANGSLVILPQYSLKSYSYENKYHGIGLNSKLHISEDLTALKGLINDSLLC